MPKTLARLLPAAVCLLPNLLFAAAQPAPPPARTDDHHASSPITELSDTLVRIARRLGLTSKPLAKANAPEQTDKIVVGNVLRLPVTPPETDPASMAPDSAKASAAQPAQAATPPEPPQAKPPAPVQPMSQPQSLTPAQTPAKADATTAAKAATPGSVPTPPAKAEPAQAPNASAAAPAQSPTKAVDATEDVVRLAVGSYANPTLGTLRIAQTPAGIAVGRDNRTIAMRHLLYGVFDGADTTGDIHGLRLQYDDAGQVRALLYSSASGKDIPFARVKK